MSGSTARPLLAELHDPVLEVTGVTAAEILRRIADVRSGRAPDLSTATAGEEQRRAVWRLVDFGDGTDADFVDDVHLAMLGRLPTEGEARRRSEQLAAGRSRFELISRLALCPEGRRRSEHPVAGLGLPALVAVGRGVERAEAHPVVGNVARAAVPLVRRAVVRSRGTRRGTRRLVRAGTAATLSVVALRQVRALRQEVVVLRRELAVVQGRET